MGRLLAQILVAALAAPAGAEVLVVVNTAAPIEHATIEALRDLFLGKRTSLDDRKAYELVVEDGTAAHEEFLDAYIKVTPSQFRITWKKQVFTGKGRYPTVCESDAAVLERVGQTRDAIGYIEASTPHPGVKVLTIDGH